MAGQISKGMRVRLARLSPSAPHYERVAREGKSLQERAQAAVQLASADGFFARDVAERGITLGAVGTVTTIYGDGWLTVRFEGIDSKWAIMHVAEALLEEATEGNEAA